MPYHYIRSLFRLECGYVLVYNNNVINLNENQHNEESKHIKEYPVFFIYQKTIKFHNLTKPVATVKAVLSVNALALGVISLDHCCYSGRVARTYG